MGQYDVAQICLNGHVINDSTQRYPEHNRKFCHQCGQPTITACPECNFDIRGDYVGGAVVIGFQFPAPAFCENCGRPYPWTSRALAAAKELTDQMQGLTEDEKAQVKDDLSELVADTPQTKVSATRVRRLLAKASGELPGMVREVIVAVASDTAKKVLLG